MKQDRMSMAASVESRVPFLDHHLAEFAARLPRRLKLRGLTGKRILKRAMREVLPAQIINRRKMGFPVPTAKWFRSELASWCREILLDGRSSADGIFNRSRLEALTAEHSAGRANHADKLWQLLNFSLWYDAVDSTRRRPHSDAAVAAAGGSGQ